MSGYIPNMLMKSFLLVSYNPMNVGCLNIQNIPRADIFSTVDRQIKRSFDIQMSQLGTKLLATLENIRLTFIWDFMRAIMIK